MLREVIKKMGEDPLNNYSRRTIYFYVKENPGAKAGEIVRVTGLDHKSVDVHIECLMDVGLFFSRKEGESSPRSYHALPLSRLYEPDKVVEHELSLLFPEPFFYQSQRGASAFFPRGFPERKKLEFLNLKKHL